MDRKPRNFAVLLEGRHALGYHGLGTGAGRVPGTRPQGRVQGLPGPGKGATGNTHAPAGPGWAYRQREDRTPQGPGSHRRAGDRPGSPGQPQGLGFRGAG